MAHSTKRRLIIHAGQIKTGSSSIQSVLARRALSVSGHKWSYSRLPKTLDHGYAAVLADWAYAQNKWYAKRAIEILRRALSVNRADTVILSAEHLSNIPLDAFVRLVDQLRPAFDETKVLVYVRPHIGAMNALFVELIKQGRTFGTYEEYFPHHLRGLFYAYKFRGWRDAFGDDLVVRPYVASELVGGSVVSDFSAVAFPGAKAKIDQGRRRNASLGIHDLMRLRVIHEGLGDHGISNRFFLSWSLAEQLSANVAGDAQKLTMPRPLAEEATRHFQNDARDFDAEFMDGAPIMQEALERERSAAHLETVSVNPNDWLSAGEIAALRSMAATIARTRGSAALWQMRVYLWHVDQILGK